MTDSTGISNTKIGIISCSGEEIPEGTISRLATRRVIEGLRPGITVTLCLPLFLAGNEGERNFARTHPTITIDGCDKQCARWGTEKHGGPVSRALVVSDILGAESTGCSRSSRARGPADDAAAAIVANRIALEVDALIMEADYKDALVEAYRAFLDGRLVTQGRGNVDTLSDTFKALSDKTRVQIMVLLLECRELCVCDFVGALGQTQSKVSRHLRYLHSSGLVKDRREGLWMHYSISADLRPEQVAILAALSNAVSEEQKQDLRRSLERWLALKASTGVVHEQGAASGCRTASGAVEGGRTS